MLRKKATRKRISGSVKLWSVRKKKLERIKEQKVPHAESGGMPDGRRAT